MKTFLGYLTEPQGGETSHGARNRTWGKNGHPAHSCCFPLFIPDSAFSLFSEGWLALLLLSHGGGSQSNFRV